MTFTHVFLACCVALAIVNVSASPSHGTVTNCERKKGSPKDQVYIDVKWSPYIIKANTEYTINGTAIVHTEISDVIEGATIWIPAKKEPIYVFPPKESNCRDSEIIKALAMFNVTCPIKAGTKVDVANLKYLLPGSGAIFTGDFIVEAYLKDKKGNQLVCVHSEFSIAK